MACKVLAERAGQEVPEILGVGNKSAKIIHSVEITENCPDIDLGTRVVISYVRNKQSKLVGLVSIETDNGVELKWWEMRTLRNLHFTRLDGFREFSRKTSLVSSVLASYIIEKAPKGV